MRYALLILVLFCAPALATNQQVRNCFQLGLFDETPVGSKEPQGALTVSIDGESFSVTSMQTHIDITGAKGLNRISAAQIAFEGRYTQDELTDAVRKSIEGLAETPQAIMDVWQRVSINDYRSDQDDNLKAFNQALAHKWEASHRKPLSEQDWLEAAKQTPIGKAAIALGYTEVRLSRNSNHRVGLSNKPHAAYTRVVFIKPQRP